MRKIFGIARYTFIEIFRNKVWYVLILFSAILIVSTLLLSTLGGEQREHEKGESFYFYGRVYSSNGFGVGRVPVRVGAQLCIDD